MRRCRTRPATTCWRSPSRTPAGCHSAAIVLADDTDPLSLSYAHQAIGIVLRDREDIDLGLEHMRTARKFAARTGDDERPADAAATLGVTLAFAVDHAPACANSMRPCAELAQGVVRAKVLMRRAHVLAYAGRHDAATEDLQEALPGFRRTGDEVWEARALNLRAYVRIGRGEFAEAERDLHEADTLFTRREQRREVLAVRHNLALIRFFRGDVPVPRRVRGGRRRARPGPR